MELFWKCTAGILISVVLTLTIGKKEQDMSLLLNMVVCCMTTWAAFSILEPVLDFVYELEKMGDLRSDTLGVLLKIVGVGLASEMAGMICRDAGCGSMGKGMQLLGSALILHLSIPIFRTLMDLIREILGGL